MNPKHPPHDTDFDLRARAELALAFDPGEPPADLFRIRPRLLMRRGFQPGLAALLIAATGAGGVLAMRPPELVRGAIEHEYYERTLRGSFMDNAQLAERLGLGKSKALPGFPQLMRPCDIDGHLVYHLTTFFEKGGMVTVFAFDEAMQIKEASGWWGSVYWRVVTSREGKPLVLVAEKKKALTVAQTALANAN